MGASSAVAMLASATMADTCARAICHLALRCPANQDALGAAGACDALTAALEAHYRVPEVVSSVCQALEQLVLGHSRNTSALSFQFAAAEMLLAAITRFCLAEPTAHSSLLLAALGCVLSLAGDRVGKHKLTTAGVAKTVTAVLQRMVTASDAASSIAAGAATGAGAAISPGAGPHFTSIQSDAFLQPYCSLLCCAIITALSSGSLELQTRLLQAGALKPLAAVAERQLTLYMSQAAARAGSSSSSGSGSSSGSSSTGSGGASTQSSMLAARAYSAALEEEADAHSQAAAAAAADGDGAGDGAGPSAAAPALSPEDLLLQPRSWCAEWVNSPGISLCEESWRAVGVVCRCKHTPHST